MKYKIIDIEADGLLDSVTKIHCVVVREYDGTVRKLFDTEDIREFLQDAIASKTTLVGHNILGYDLPVLRLLVYHCEGLRVIDTLVLSRMLNYSIKGGHSLEAWGERFGVPKVGSGIEDWSSLTELMLERCISDTEINLRLFKKMERFIDDPEWAKAIETEHDVARVCLQMEQTGIPFNTPAARELREYIVSLIEPLDAVISRDFKPKAVPIKEVTPRISKDGSLNRQDFRWWDSDDLSVFTGGPFTRFEYREFNPGSPKQIVERLNEAGWKPVEKTDGHAKAARERKATQEHKTYGWKISEKNLETLPDSAPEGARSIAKRIVLQSRLSDLDEWLALVKPDGRIHPKFRSIGAWTGRLSHQNPNCANIPAYKPSDHDTEFQKMINEINKKMRALFYAPKGKRLIGTDADGIQMRIFADLVNDKKLIEALVNGKKETGTDIHSLHRDALGDTAGSRDEAKTFIYAFILGASTPRISEIFGCSTAAARIAIDNFLEFYPGLKQLKKTLIPQWANRGYFIGLDGRKVACDSEHLMLAGILQNGEKVIMARAMIQWMAELNKQGIEYELVNWVHDEWQTLIDDDDELCARVQAIQIQAIRDQGDALGMKCPLEGSSDWGYNWMETH